MLFWLRVYLTLGSRITRGIVVGWFSVQSIIGFAQLSQPARFELTYENGDQSFTIVSLKESGLSMIRQKDKTDDGKKPWEVILLDTALQQTWRTEIALDFQFILVGYEYVPGELFFLFRHGESTRNDLHLVRIYLFNHAVQEYDIKPNLDLSLTHFTVVGNSAILGGYVARQSTVFLFEMGSNHMKVIPGFFIDNTELLEVKANRNRTFNVLMVERGIREKKLLQLRTFDESGALLLEDDIELEGDKSILAGTTSTLENDELFLAGTWGPGGAKKSTGFFSVLVDPFHKQPMHYYDFGELQHFFDYMTPRQITKNKSKANKRRHEQKPPHYRADVHVVKIEENAKGFFLLAELYVPATTASYPPYYTNNPYYAGNPYYNPYGFSPMANNRYNTSPYSTPYSTYSNPQYGSNNRVADITIVHSSLVIFDQQGKLKEDFGLPMDDVKHPSVDQVSDFCATDKYVQFYKKEKNIFAATSWDNGNALEQDTAKIRLRSSDDVIRSESEDEGGIRHWYGSIAYAWGYETIKNKTEHSFGQVRYVYYVNKIKME